MRPRIHGWIISLLLVGAGGLAIGAYAFRNTAHSVDTTNHDSLDPAQLAAFVAAQLRAQDKPAAREETTKHATDSTESPNPPQAFDTERFAAQAKAREER